MAAGDRWERGEGGPAAGGARPRAVGRCDRALSVAATGRGVALKQGKIEREGTLMCGPGPV
jgi:hypothetical protein